MCQGKRKGTTLHVCHNPNCRDLFYGNVSAKFCCSSCRSLNCKWRSKLVVTLLQSFFEKIGFSVDDLRGFRERCLDRLYRVAELLGYVWNEWDREWKHE